MNVHRLDGRRTTLLLLDRDAGLPEIVHWGVRLPDGIGADEAAALRDRAVAQNALDADVPTATLLPTLGAGTFGAPAIAAHRGTGDWTVDCRAQIRTEPGRIVVDGVDEVAKVSVAITLTLPADGDVLTTEARLRNDGDDDLHVEHLAAGAFRLPPEAADLLTFGGRWAREFVEARIALPYGAHVTENRRGRTSHDRFPLLIAGTDGFAEARGEVWGIHLGAPGNHRTVAERLPDGSLLVTAGELLHPGEAVLGPGETLTTPVAHAAWSADGLAGLSRAFHAHVRARVLRWPGGAMTPRPVTLNTWEGTYFAHDEARLMRTAEAAAALGCERFVLDDGWMKARHDATAGLGDWTPDPKKYPTGLAPLAQRVVALGMQFGLWVEPEMANPYSDVLRARPDAVLHVAGRPLRTARNQLVLDLTRADLAESVFVALDTLLRALPIAYLKWDMNRDLVAAGDAHGHPAYRRQAQAVHALMDRLRAAHTALEIETCASGGGRADLGTLARTHRVWTSDGTDALDRLGIQLGASRLLPPEILGAHVSGSPNHQTGRRHTLAFRAAVALFGHFGVELDPLGLSLEDQTELAAWIALHKRLRPLLHAGEHVAADPRDGRVVSGVVAPAHAAYLVAQTASPAYALPAPLSLPGLDAGSRYRLTAPAPQRPPARLSDAHRRLFADGLVLSGGALAAAGFVPPPLFPETALVLEAVREEA